MSKYKQMQQVLSYCGVRPPEHVREHVRRQVITLSSALFDNAHVRLEPKKTKNKLVDVYMRRRLHAYDTQLHPIVTVLCSTAHHNHLVIKPHS
jgi:hypothetical protein